MTDAIVAEGLRKCFAEVEAVIEISFSVRQGELFGFLEPNVSLSPQADWKAH